MFGDVHGQLYDLIDIMRSLDIPNALNGKLLFLGDYVDRGSFGIEIVLMLFTLKLCYPQDVYLLRGNHETRGVTDFFNFREECI